MQGGADQFAEIGRQNLLKHHRDSEAQRANRSSAPASPPGPSQTGVKELQRLNADPHHQRRAHNGQKAYLSRERERARDSKQLRECLAALCEMPDRKRRFESDYTKKLARPEPYMNAVGASAQFTSTVDLSAEVLSVSCAGLRAVPLAGASNAEVRFCPWRESLTFQEFRAYFLEFLPASVCLRVTQDRRSR